MSSQPLTLPALPLDGISAAVPSPEHPAPLIVRGPRRTIAAARVTARVAWLALRAYRDPIRAARAVGGLFATMRALVSTDPARRSLWTSGKCVAWRGRYFWDLYAPGFPSPAFDHTVEWELDRIDAIGRPAGVQTAIIAVTRRCSLACEHCLEGDALNQPETLSADDLRDIVRRVQEGGAAQIFFSGGEPLQRFGDLLAVSAQASATADVWILTSGRGLTAGRAQRLAGAGVTGVALSLDHWNPEAHDRFRGTPGLFEAVRLAAARARAAGLLVTLSLCPTRSFVTADNLRRYGDTARSLGASFIQILEPKPIGRYGGLDVTLEPAEQRLLEAFCDRLNTDAAAADLPAVRYQDWSARTFGCSGGHRYVYIDADGGMHACPFCRAPGVRVLDRDFHTALGQLRRAACRTGADDDAPTERTLLWTR